MKIKLKTDAIKEFALLMAPCSAGNPYYLNGEELVGFFNGIGAKDQFVWENEKGICSNEFGEGLSRLDYVIGRLIGYNKKGESLSVFVRFASMFEDKQPLLIGANDILKKFKVSIIIELSDNDTIKINEFNVPISTTPMILFISYSHDSDSHKTWVKHLAEDLRASGFEVLLDQDNPSGTSLTLFMNEGIDKADKVLVIGTPEYSNKSKQQSGGAAYEGAIMSVTLLNNLCTTKFVPILRKGNFASSFPILIGDRVGFDFSEDSEYDNRLGEMINKFKEEFKQ